MLSDGIGDLLTSMHFLVVLMHNYNYHNNAICALNKVVFVINCSEVCLLKENLTLCPLQHVST